jgi:hypothetical protein
MQRNLPPIVDMKGLISLYAPVDPNVKPWMTEQYIKKQIHLKNIPHIKKGKKLLFDPKEIDEWIRKGYVVTNEEIASTASTDFFLNRKKRW